MVICPRKWTNLGPKWQLLTTGPWKVERVLNSANYVIRRVGGCNRRVVHADRLQRYVEASPNSVVLASQPTHAKIDVARRPNLARDSSVSQPEPNHLGSGDVLTNQRSPHEAASETAAVTIQIQRKRLRPERLRSCRQENLRSLRRDTLTEAMVYTCPCCSKGFTFRSGRRRHCIAKHKCRSRGGGVPEEIPPMQNEAVRTTVRVQSRRTSSCQPKADLRGLFAGLVAILSRRTDVTVFEGDCPVDLH